MVQICPRLGYFWGEGLSPEPGAVDLLKKTWMLRYAGSMKRVHRMGLREPTNRPRHWSRGRSVRSPPAVPLRIRCSWGRNATNGGEGDVISVHICTRRDKIKQNIHPNRSFWTALQIIYIKQRRKPGWPVSSKNKRKYPKQRGGRINYNFFVSHKECTCYMRSLGHHHYPWWPCSGRSCSASRYANSWEKPVGKKWGKKRSKYILKPRSK